MSRFRNVGDISEIDQRNRVPSSLSLCQWSVVGHRRVCPSQRNQLLLFSSTRVRGIWWSEIRHAGLQLRKGKGFWVSSSIEASSIAFQAFPWH